jgi:L-fuconolactonase
MRFGDCFGEDRLLFGSDWPNWDTQASLGESVRVMRAYVSRKSRVAALKFFAENAKAAYQV